MRGERTQLKLQANWRLAAEMGRSLAGSAALSPKISGLVVPIRLLMMGSAHRGAQIYRGHFCFNGRTIHSRGASIFEISEADAAWLEELHGFAWLTDLEATGLELARVHARALISDWLDRDTGHKRSADGLTVVARRLMSWITAAPFLLDHASADFLAKFWAGLSSHIRDLQLRSTLCISPSRRLACATALAYAAIALSGMEPWRATILDWLADRLDAQILPDGGHASRNPAELVQLLLDLTPLRLACEMHRITMPPPLQAALERMMPMLRFFLHGDGGLAMFGGGADALVAQCSAILDSDGTQGMPISNALHSRYMRLAHGSTVVIFNSAPNASSDGSVAPLAFELSDGPCRIVTNCGPPLRPNDAGEGDSPSADYGIVTLLAASKPAPLPFLEGLGLRRSAPPQSEPMLASTPAGSLAEANHACFALQTGYAHERRLYLSSSGADLRGEDRFVPNAGAEPGEAHFALGFHLHPDVTPTRANDGSSLVLLCQRNIAWIFMARGAEIALEPCLCQCGADAARKTLRIVLSGCVSQTPVRWAFKRSPDCELRLAGEERP
ncbi:MAG TPA: heparinase II/III family protein [Aestuariivirgaceae bacterium]|jgi:uncharacterized heparinase superfamily protein